MTKKDFKNIAVSDTDSDFNLNEVAHSNNEATPSKKYKVSIPKRVNYCIRLQEDIYNEFYKIIEQKFNPSDRAHKRSEIIEDLLLTYIKSEKK